MTNNDLPHVVIVGGGFGGLYAARALRGAPVKLTVVDRRNFHLFQPLLYQVATAALSPGDIANPIRSILAKQNNAEVLMAEVTDIDVNGRRVIMADGELLYDYLIVATGSTHAYFGHSEWERFAPGLKTVEDAEQIRQKFLIAFEAAEREPLEDVRRRLMTFVIVGGGPTGVELAGAMAEIARNAIPAEFRHIDTRRARIILLEGGGRVLPTYPEDLSVKAHKQLERLGVEVRTSCMVTNIDEGCVAMGEEEIRTENVFWAAGVAASPLGARLGAKTDNVGRVIVEKDCSVPGRPEVFVVGDLAHVEQEDGSLVPGVAQGGIQMGKHVGKLIRAELRGDARRPFHFIDKGLIATIGRAAAVAQIWKLHLSGFIAWFVWVFIHIFYLIGFRNRLIVLIQWGWAYLWFKRGVRLITGDTHIERLHTRAARELGANADRAEILDKRGADWSEPAPVRHV